ncbi:MAG: aminotransferase class V-fold PLP-dependent enzyme [Gemmatimonadaceae bacterium]|nr:aminotransferase class V-fold PLP-dependent enzyme [Gemmatimonadaceae bacterium]
MILFSPGPSNISERVRRALLHPDIGHRESEFHTILTALVAGVRAVAALPPGPAYDVTFLGGSGSVGIESVVAACRSVGRVLVIANGPYGERAAAMAREFGVEVDEWRLPWGAAIPLAELEARLARDPVGALYVVHHETATGRLNPLESIAALGRAHGALICTDAVSSFGGERLDIVGWGLDAVVASANKCLRGVPGAAFVISSERFAARALATPRAHYADLATHRIAQRDGAFPFTPPLHPLFALREALAETLDEGVAMRIAHYHALAQRTHEGLSTLGLTPVIPFDASGHTIVAAPLPPGVDYGALHGPLKAQGLCIYAAQGAMARTHFRVGLIGHFGLEAVEQLLAAMATLPRGR